MGPSVEGEVSGNIIDLDGALVQNATVTCAGRTATSNTSGAYVINDLPEGTFRVRATSQPNNDGITFSAETRIQVFPLERSKSVNLTLVRSDQQASIHGVVRDRFGFVLQGAKVFAFIESGGAQLSSIQDVTDSNGEYELHTMAAGFTYIVNGSARGFSSDRDSVVLKAGEDRRYDITVGDAADPLLAPPANLTAVAWTSPATSLRGIAAAPAYENLKRRFDPDRAKRKGKAEGVGQRTINGNNVEVDLSWDFPTTNLQYLLGYGVYRATSALGTSVGIDFLRDPETNFYADLDDVLIEDQNYYDEITALNVRYPDTFNSESDFSDRYGVQTLGDLFLDPVTQGPLTFRWESGSGATSYFVYLFDEFPTIGVSEIWVNPVAAVGTSQAYTGPALVSGRRYYYMVLGLANSDDSRTISDLGEFVAN